MENSLFVDVCSVEASFEIMNEQKFNLFPVCLIS